MRQDTEVGTVITTEDIEEEGPCGNGDTATGGEPGAGKISEGESGGVRKPGEHR